MNDPDAIAAEATRRLAQGPDAAMLATLAQAVSRHPGHAGLALRHADALQHARRLPEAEAEYERALSLDAAAFDAWYGLGMSRAARGAYQPAIEAMRAALRIVPDAAPLRANLAEMLFQTGAVDEALAEYAQAMRSPDAAVCELAARNRAIIAPGAPGADNAAVRDIRAAWIATLPAAPRRAAADATGRRLRIGYVSSFFGRPNWMKPVFAVLHAHDRARFEIHLLCDGDPPSAEGGYAPHDDDRIWSIRGASNERIAAAVAGNGIDVLVDLNGYSAPPRLGLFTLRAAPVQLGWFNMFATTGSAAFDALVGDDAVIPPAEEAFYAERILRVPGSYLAFRVNHPAPPVVSPPCCAAGHLTFGSLCSAYKLTEPTLAVWSQILLGVPDARLLLRNSSFADPSTRAAVAARFAHDGIAPERLDLLPPAPHLEFLATYDRIDIALDAFPYNGGTTTTEALWQGVPVLAFDGDRWAARTSRSLLLAAGLADWVAGDAAAYVSQAIARAQDPATPARLAALRAGMRDRLLASPVCDVAGLCRSLEDIYLAEHAAARG